MDRSSALPASRAPAPAPLAARVVAGLDVAVIMVTVTLMVLVAAEVTGAVRLMLALAFVTFVPGWAVLDHVTLVAGANARVAVAVALSLTIATLSSLALLWLHLWYPVVLLDVLGCLSLLAVLAHLLRPASR
jgi:uncharacterized membrane protein